MSATVFENIALKKQKMAEFADSALEKNWINKETRDSIQEKLDNDTLTIGVIGQMKCGKSTFLNAFIFEDEVLPAATTPMTAALSVITYGEKESVEAEFYSQQEWDEIVAQSNMNLADVDDNSPMASKIKAARELVGKSSRIASQISVLLGTKKTDYFANLIEYVGADGKYVAITKSVTIHYPKEYLKGVEIVDTPGFNDPVVSREERTKDFLKKADVVLMMLYAGRAFDSTDRSIIFKNVRNVGVGKILIGVNKYDLNYARGETLEEISGNVKSEIRKACKEDGDPIIKELLTDAEPVLFSANMALMAKMPFSKVQSSENLKFHWERTCDDFEISTQKEMLQESRIGNLESAILTTIEKSKAEILFKKPLNLIMQSGINISDSIGKSLNEKKVLLENLSRPDDELDEQIEGLNKTQKRVDKAIGRCVESLKENYDDKAESCIKKIGEIIESAEHDMYDAIDNAKRGSAQYELEKRIDRLNRDLQNTESFFEKEFRKMMLEAGDELAAEVEELIARYVQDPEDLTEALKCALRKVEENSSETSAQDGEADENNEDSPSFLGFIGECFKSFIKGFLIIPIIIDMLSWRSEMKDKVREFFTDATGYIEEMKEKFAALQDSYINRLNTEAAQQVLQSLISKLEEFKNSKADRELAVGQLKKECEKLQADKTKIEADINNMQQLKVQLAII